MRKNISQIIGVIMKKIFNKTNLLILPITLILFLAVNLNAQVLEWAMQTEGLVSQGEGKIHIDIDEDENLYMAGKFEGILELDLKGSGSLKVEDLHPPNVGSPNFVAKYNSNGAIIWAFALGALATEEYEHFHINDLHVDKDGNILIVGEYGITNLAQSGIDFDPGTGTTVLTSSRESAFAAKYDTDGNLLWAFSLYSYNSVDGGIINNYQDINGVTTDTEGNIFLTGRITAQVLGPGIEILVDLNPLGSETNVNIAGAIVAKYSPDGLLQWHKIYPRTDGFATQGSVGEKIVLDSGGNIFTTGWFSRIVDFGNGFTNTVDQSTVGTYLLKLDSNGNTTWMILLDNDIPDLGAMEPFAILSTASDNVVLVGTFDNTVDFDPGPGVATLTSFLTVSGVYDDDGFIVSYDTDGNFRWVDHVGGGTRNERIFSVVENSDGDIFATGDGNTGFFLKKLDGQTGTQLALYEEGIEIALAYEAAISPNDNLYLNGIVSQDSIDVDFGGNEYYIFFSPSVGLEQTLFLAKYKNASQLPTGVESYDDEIPNTFQLEQNYPNPFNPSTQIRFAIPKSANVKLDVYNLLGQKVASLVSENLSAGSYSVEWNAKKYSSGTYIYTIRMDNEVHSKKMMMIK